jgi:hypothetical protein
MNVNFQKEGEAKEIKIKEANDKFDKAKQQLDA